jgi:acetyl esterase/lipase
MVRRVDLPSPTLAKKNTHLKTGGGFAVAANIAYFELFNTIIEELNAAGKDIAIFWVTYTLTPHAVYPAQMRQSVEALRYIIKDANRAPANVFIGGDSAGGNLVFTVLSHLSHPHPEIEPLELSENLGGALAMAPWVSFSQDFPSMKENAYKDMLPLETLKNWSDLYIAGAKGDNYNQALLAPAEWWSGLKANHVLIVLGGDEVFRSSIEQFAERLKVRRQL